MRFAILIDERTVLKSEIFAQSMKELFGAFVVGVKSAGNISITKTFRMDKRKGLRITVAKMFPSSGIDLTERGVLPDFKVSLNSSLETGQIFFYPLVILNNDAPCQKAIELLKK